MRPTLLTEMLQIGNVMSCWKFIPERIPKEIGEGSPPGRIILDARIYWPAFRSFNMVSGIPSLWVFESDTRVMAG